jgi:ABC-2 type transport system ATP-binding protein
MTVAGAPAVVCEGLVVRYGTRTAVDGLTLHAGAGEVLAVLGPNGAGKTTTVESLTGFRRPDAGTLAVLGLDPRRDHAALVHRVGVMLQRGGVYPMLSPARALALFAAYYDDPEDPGALLATLSLTDVATTPWRNLSGGEQQRLSLALALVGRPEVVFLDEPTAGVDPEGRLAVRAVVEDLRRRGVCVVLTTHELAEAEQLADRVVIVHHGTVMAEGTPAELARTAPGGGPGGGPGPRVRFGAPPGLDTADLSAALGAAVAETAPGRYQVAAAGTPALTAALATWLAARDAALVDLRTGDSLEETYLALVGEATASPPAAPTSGERGRRRRRAPTRGAGR